MCVCGDDGGECDAAKDRREDSAADADDGGAERARCGLEDEDGWVAGGVVFEDSEALSWWMGDPACECSSSDDAGDGEGPGVAEGGGGEGGEGGEGADDEGRVFWELPGDGAPKSIAVVLADAVANDVGGEDDGPGVREDAVEPAEEGGGVGPRVWGGECVDHLVCSSVWRMAKVSAMVMPLARRPSQVWWVVVCPSCWWVGQGQAGSSGEGHWASRVVSVSRAAGSSW